ncbi:FIST N-terminal domain-containing protein [Actinoplanes sp. NPDC051851]|uniref:FIST signal transduction protein n=1 Tax=Actinoplanes sp. NPDC051851 TaxID=3154753 RepID=UPI003436CC87
MGERDVLGHGSSRNDDAYAAAEECVRQAFGGREPTADDLVLVFPTIHYDPHLFFAAAQRAAGNAQVVGCTAYRSFTSDANLVRGAVALYVPAADLRFGVAIRDGIHRDVFGAAKDATSAARERAGGDAGHSVLMVISDGFAGDQRAVVRGCYTVTGATVPMIGGAAAEDISMIATYQYANGQVTTNGMIAVWINSPRPLGIGVAHGWHPIGSPMIVTRAEKNVIHELDGRPAVEAYFAQRGTDLPSRVRDGLWEEPFARAALGHPLGLADTVGRFDGRHILDRTPDGALVMFGHVSEHSVVQVMAGNHQDLLEASRRSGADAAGQLDGPPRGAIVFSCAGRAGPLGKEIEAEAVSVGEGMGGAPIGGFFTYGEFARVTGSTGFHNATVVTLAL